MRLYSIPNVSELSRRLGYERPERVRNVFVGNSLPSFGMLADLTKTFGEVDMHWLLTGEGSALAKPLPNAIESLNQAIKPLKDLMDGLRIPSVPNLPSTLNSPSNSPPKEEKPPGSVRFDLHSTAAEPRAPYGQPVVTVNDEGQPRIVMLDSRAAAGLPAHHGDAEFYRDQPVMHIPGYRYRDKGIIAIQVTGDSMSPTINHEDWLIARPLLNPMEEIREGYVHLLVTRDGAVAKRLFKAKGRAAFVCKSDNLDYPSYEQDVDGNAAVYIVLATLSEDLSNKGGGIRERVTKLERDLLALKSQLKLT